MLVLSMLQLHFKLINHLFTPLQLLTLKNKKQWVQLPAQLQTHFKAVPTKLGTHLHSLTDVKSSVYSSASQLRFVLWFNYS